MCRTEPASPSAQWINESKGRGLPVGPLASLRRRSTAPIHKRPCPVRYAHILPANTERYPGRRELLPVPSGLFHAGQVPGDRPYRRAGYHAKNPVLPVKLSNSRFGVMM